MHTTPRRLHSASVAVAAVAALTALTAGCTSTSSDAHTATAATAATTITVPVDYIEPITTAARTCTENGAADSVRISPELLAAQVWAVSGFDARAETSGAVGPAQLTQDQQQALRDVDGNGRASAYDIADAVDALATIDCRISSDLTAAGIEATPENIAATLNGGPDYRDTDLAQQYASKVVDASTQVNLT